MGCIARLGCLVLLCILAVVGWFTRDRWMPMLHLGGHAAAGSTTTTWQPLSDAGAERTRAALGRLSQPRGPVFATLSGSDVASYVYKSLTRQLPASADSVEVAVIDDRVSMRASVPTRELGGSGVLGPLASMLGDRERVQLGGTLRVVKAGLGEFHVQELKIGNLNIPRAMIPRLLRQMSRAPRPADVSDDALPLPLPSYVGDIRVANGRITLYKNVQ